MKIFYDLAACLVTVLLIIPVGLWAAVLAFVEVVKVFPHNVIDIFDKLYDEK